MTVLGKVVAICTDIFTEAVVDNIALGDDGFNNFLENVLLNENLCSLKMVLIDFEFLVIFEFLFFLYKLPEFR